MLGTGVTEVDSERSLVESVETLLPNVFRYKAERVVVRARR